MISDYTEILKAYTVLTNVGKGVGHSEFVLGKRAELQVSEMLI